MTTVQVAYPYEAPYHYILGPKIGGTYSCVQNKSGPLLVVVRDISLRSLAMGSNMAVRVTYVDRLARVGKRGHFFEYAFFRLPCSSLTPSCYSSGGWMNFSQIYPPWHVGDDWQARKFRRKRRDIELEDLEHCSRDNDVM